MSAERVVGGRNIVTPHGADAYPGLLVVRPDARWSVAVIVPNDGDTIVARGGEEAYPYEIPGGGRAAGFKLQPGDRATLARAGLAHFLVEWHIERAPQE